MYKKLQKYKITKKNHITIGVRGKRGYDLVVGRRESLFGDSSSSSFRGNVLLGCHTTQKNER